MKYVVYGVNRVAKDFVYIFSNLDILYFAEDKIETNIFCGKDVKNLEHALNDSAYDKIIVCDFDKLSKIKNLEDYGLYYGKDYLVEEDFFDSLDEKILPDDKKIAMWGTGKNASAMYAECPDIVPDFYIDNFKSQDSFMGKTVLHPSEIRNWKELFVIVAIDRNEEVYCQLNEYGLTNNKDYVSYQRILAMPSRMLMRTIFDKSCYDLTCNTMLNHLEILHQGDTRCCCTVFVRENMDNIFDKGMFELWHSHVHKIMCLSTQNKTYSFCDKNMCPLFIGKKNDSKTNLEDDYLAMTDVPEVIAVGHDTSCNLACTTCRKHIQVAKGEELSTVNRITSKIKSEYLDGCKFLIMAGDGEVFLTKSYKDIYMDEKCSPNYIRLLSNGTLFNENRWNEFIYGKNSKVMLTVSIDAATKETYEKIRVNGNFDKLKENMLFASKLRKSGELRYFRFNFVVQRDNYKEMIQFVQWGEELGVDEIFFTKILNWGTYSKEEFANISMMEEDGITPKKELVEVLDNPIIKNSTIVDLGTIRYSHKIDDVGVVDNYYKWELEKRGGKIFD